MQQWQYLFLRTFLREEGIGREEWRSHECDDVFEWAGQVLGARRKPFGSEMRYHMQQWPLAAQKIYRGNTQYYVRMRLTSTLLHQKPLQRIRLCSCSTVRARRMCRYDACRRVAPLAEVLGPAREASKVPRYPRWSQDMKATGLMVEEGISELEMTWCNGRGKQRRVQENDKRIHRVRG